MNTNGETVFSTSPKQTSMTAKKMKLTNNAKFIIQPVMNPAMSPMIDDTSILISHDIPELLSLSL